MFLFLKAHTGYTMDIFKKGKRSTGFKILNDVERSWPWREKLIGCKIGAIWVAEENEVAPRTQDKSFDKILAPEIDNHADLA